MSRFLARWWNPQTLADVRWSIRTTKRAGWFCIILALLNLLLLLKGGKQ